MQLLLQLKLKENLFYSVKNYIQKPSAYYYF